MEGLSYFRSNMGTGRIIFKRWWHTIKLQNQTSPTLNEAQKNEHPQSHLAWNLSFIWWHILWLCAHLLGNQKRHSCFVGGTKTTFVQSLSNHREIWMNQTLADVKCRNKSLCLPFDISLWHIWTDSSAQPLRRPSYWKQRKTLPFIEKQILNPDKQTWTWYWQQKQWTNLFRNLDSGNQLDSEGVMLWFFPTHVEHTFSFLLDDSSTLAATCADGSVFISALLLTWLLSWSLQEHEVTCYLSFIFHFHFILIRHASTLIFSYMH